MTMEDIQDSEHISLNRRRLGLGKYTRWAVNLSEEELYGLLWFIGELGMRTNEHNLIETINSKGRPRTGLLGILRFAHGRPMNLEEAKKAIRNAYKSNDLE